MNAFLALIILAQAVGIVGALVQGVRYWRSTPYTKALPWLLMALAGPVLAEMAREALR